MKKEEILLKIDEFKFLYNSKSNDRLSAHTHYLTFFVLIMNIFLSIFIVCISKDLDILIIPLLFVFIITIVSFFIITKKQDIEDTDKLNNLGDSINKLYRMLEEK